MAASVTRPHPLLFAVMGIVVGVVFAQYKLAYVMAALGLVAAVGAPLLAWFALRRRRTAAAEHCEDGVRG
jgi:hypothetical protein